MNGFGVIVDTQVHGNSATAEGGGVYAVSNCVVQRVVASSNTSDDVAGGYIRGALDRGKEIGVVVIAVLVGHEDQIGCREISVLGGVSNRVDIDRVSGGGENHRGGGDGMDRDGTGVCGENVRGVPSSAGGERQQRHGASGGDCLEE